MLTQDEHGQFPAPAVATMEEVGSWLDLHGEAIYESEPVWPHVYNLTGSSAASGVTQLRLTQAHGAVFVSVFLEPSTVPRAADGEGGGQEEGAAAPCARLPLPLPLPFVVEGGVDSSWPSTELAGVELLGHPALELNGTLDEHGLAVSGLPTGCLPAGIAHVAVLKLRYDA